MQQQRNTIKYPILQKVFRMEPEELNLLRIAYTPDELRQHEHRLATGSWDAKFVPQLVRDARSRLSDKAPQ